MKSWIVNFPDSGDKICVVWIVPARAFLVCLYSSDSDLSEIWLFKLLEIMNNIWYLWVAVACQNQEYRLQTSSFGKKSEPPVAGVLMLRQCNSEDVEYPTFTCCLSHWGMYLAVVKPHWAWHARPLTGCSAHLLSRAVAGSLFEVGMGLWAPSAAVMWAFNPGLSPSCRWVSFSEVCLNCQ